MSIDQRHGLSEAPVAFERDESLNTTTIDDTEFVWALEQALAVAGHRATAEHLRAGRPVFIAIDGIPCRVRPRREYEEGGKQVEGIDVAIEPWPWDQT